MRYSYEFKRKCVELYRQDVGLQYICLIYLLLSFLLSATFQNVADNRKLRRFLCEHLTTRRKYKIY